MASKYLNWLLTTDEVIHKSKMDKENKSEISEKKSSDMNSILIMIASEFEEDEQKSFVTATGPSEF